MDSQNPYDTLDLKQLKCFWAAARFGSLTRAGIELGISESAVSQRIRALETYLGHKLYQTPGGRMRLTGEGEKVFQRAITLFEQIQDLRRELSENQMRGPLKVAASEHILLYLLPTPIQRFTQAYPEVGLQIQTGKPPEIIGLVQRSEIDLGLIAYEAVPDNLVFRPWCEFPGYMITPLGHPIARAKNPTVFDFIKYPLVLPERDFGTFRRVKETLEQEGLAFKVAVEAGGWETVKQYVAMGLGIAVVSGICLTDGDKSRLHAIPIPDEFLASTTYGIVMRRNKISSPILQSFLANIDPKFFKPL